MCFGVHNYSVDQSLYSSPDIPSVLLCFDVMSGNSAEGTLSKASPTPTVIGNEEKIIYVTLLVFGSTSAGSSPLTGRV